MTACLSCKQSSPHEAWYHFPPPVANVEEAEAKEETGVV
jgi:hypothetical protein